MVNVKKNIVVTAIWETILLILYVPMLTILSQGPGKSSWVMIFLTFGVILTGLIMLRRVGKMGLRHRIKIFDIAENGQPADMFHNDEREWRLMLTAQYVSARVTTLFALITMVAIPVTLGGFISANVNYHPSLFLMVSILTAVIAAGLLVSEWSYVIAYFKLDKG